MGERDVTDVDEWLHPPSVDDPGWTEEVAVLGWDERADLVVFAAIRLWPFEPRAVSQGVVWVQDRVRCHDAAEDAVPPHNWDVMEVGGVGLRMEQARQRWTLSTVAPQAFLVFDALSACGWVGESAYVQHGTLRGDVVVDGDRSSFDGIAVRVHSWGVDAAGGCLWVEPGHVGVGAPLAPAGERLAQVVLGGEQLDAWCLAPAGVALGRVPV